MPNPSSEASLHAAPDAGVEAELLRRGLAGDLDAFNGLVELHQRLVFNICLRMLGNGMAAEDATQEAFVSAWRNIASFRGQSFRAWLTRIAANACTDELRRRGRRHTVSLDEPAPGEDVVPDVPDHAPGPEEAALRTAQRRLIGRALLELPSDQRLAVVMCDVQGFAYEEIAEAMGTSVGTVKSRIARGREKLRRILAAEHPGG
jgi:RNA polymerase sigma-70 factor (ECF subfamily)